MTGRRGGRAQLAPGDRGAGTVLVLALVAVALVCLAATGAVGAAAVAGARAASAADLAALAGADVLLGRAAGEPCAAAGATAAANGARLTSCAVTGTDLGGVEVGIAVAVEVVLDAPSAAPGAVARARARAGLPGADSARTRRGAPSAARRAPRPRPPCRDALWRMNTDTRQLVLADAHAWRARIAEHVGEHQGVWLVLVEQGATKPGTVRAGTVMRGRWWAVAGRGRLGAVPGLGRPGAGAAR